MHRPIPTKYQREKDDGLKVDSLEEQQLNTHTQKSFENHERVSTERATHTCLEKNKRSAHLPPCTAHARRNFERKERTYEKNILSPQALSHDEQKSTLDNST